MLKNGKPNKLASQLLPHPVWEAVEPIIPNLRPNRKTPQGRKPVPHREALSGILFVLRTGVSWEELPLELGWGTGMTCWRRVRALQKAKAWPKIVQVLANLLPDGQEIPFDRMKDFRPRGPRKKRQPEGNEPTSNGAAAKGKKRNNPPKSGRLPAGRSKQEPGSRTC